MKQIQLFILVLILATIELYLLSFLNNDLTVFNEGNKYLIPLKISEIKWLSITLSILSLIFLYKKVEDTPNVFWGALMILEVLAITLLGGYHFFVTSVELGWSWFWATLFSLVSTLICFLFGTNKLITHL